VGAATACFAAARDYVKERKQFGKPLGAFQLVQEKLARMYTDIASPSSPASSWRGSRRGAR